MSVSLNKIVDVTVQVSATSSISNDFNLGCIIGKSVASLAGQIKTYTASNYATQMITDGFTTSSPEYALATKYFAQSSRPGSLDIAQYSTTDATVKTPDTAFTWARANSSFYAFTYAFELTTQEITAIAALVEASAKPSIFFYTTDDPQCLVSGSTNILKTAQTNNWTRSFGFYVSENHGIDTAIAMVGLVSGLNTMQANSAYTVAYKTLAGVSSEDITDAQVDILVGYNGNAYLNFSDSYDFVYPGVSGGGYHVDEIYLMDVAKSLIQNTVVNTLVNQKKIPQTDSGVNIITNAIAGACNRMANVGLIASGIWKGEPVDTLATGDAIENGYYIYADSVANQTPAERASRISPPIHVALLSSGAIEHVVITVFVNR